MIRRTRSEDRVQPDKTAVSCDRTGLGIPKRYPTGREGPDQSPLFRRTWNHALTDTVLSMSRKTHAYRVMRTHRHAYASMQAQTYIYIYIYILHLRLLSYMIMLHLTSMKLTPPTPWSNTESALRSLQNYRAQLTLLLPVTARRGHIDANA